MAPRDGFQPASTPDWLDHEPLLQVAEEILFSFHNFHQSPPIFSQGITAHIAPIDSYHGGTPMG